MTFNNFIALIFTTYTLSICTTFVFDGFLSLFDFAYRYTK